jgi:uncharacterized membrane protein
MSQIIIALSFWLHSLATVLLIGYYLLLILIFIPVLNKGGETFLSEISRRSRTWLYISLLVFLVTGVYLTFVDPNYLGIGDFGNPWSVLMLVKHLLVLGMIAIGFWVNAIWRSGPRMRTDEQPAQALGRFRWYSNIMGLLGVAILLLTAISQAQ